MMSELNELNELSKLSGFDQRPARVGVGAGRVGRLSRIVACAGVVACAGLGSVAEHADAAQPTSSSVSYGGGGAQPAEAGGTLDLDFRGGSVGDYIELVRRTSKDVLNFVVPDDVAQVPMLPLTLRAVAVEDAVDMVRRMARPKNSMPLRVEQLPGRGSLTFVIERMPVPQGPFGVPGGMPGGMGQGEVPSVTRVFSLNEIVGPAWAGTEPAPGRLTAEVVLASLEQALSISSPEDPVAEVRFHTDSGLLFVRSTPAQAEVAERTIQTLQNDVRTAARAGAESRQPKVIRLARIKPAELIDAVRAVYPVGMENGPEVVAGEDSVTISASQRIQFGIEALAAYLDGPKNPSMGEIQAQMEVLGLRERLEQARQEQDAVRKEAASMAAEVRAVAIELERTRLQAQESEGRAARARDIEAQLRDTQEALGASRRELEEAYARLKRLEEAATKEKPR